MRLVVIGFILIAGCAGSLPSVKDRLDVKVESWQSVDVAPLNARIEAAVATGAGWPRSPLRVTVELLGADIDTRSVWLTAQGNRGEVPDTTVVIAVRDGFLDDSLRGDWHRIAYHRLGDGTWRVHEMGRAYRCWRGHHLNAFSAQLCP
jgi:hypothetical protein